MKCGAYFTEAPSSAPLHPPAMPKLYEYLGLDVFLYSNEHQPVHVHGRFPGREGRAGEPAAGNPQGDTSGAREATKREIVGAKAQDIVQKWVDYFVLHKSVSLEKITRHLP